MKRAVRSHVRRSGAPAGLVAGLVLLGLLPALAVGPASAVAADAPAADRQGPNADANVTVYRATDASFGSAAAVEAAIANGSLEPGAELVVGDTLVVAVDAPRLAETMGGGNGSATDRFLDALDGDADLRIVEVNPSPQTNRKVTSVGPENVTVHRTGTTTYLLVDTGALEFRYRSVNRSTRIHGDERFAVEFGYDLPELSRGGYEPAGPVVEFHPFRAAFVGHGYWYEPLPPEWVEVSVNVEMEPAESLVARVRLGDGRTVSAPVEPGDASGTHGVWLDLRDVEPGTGYVLELVHDGGVVDRYSGTVREPRATLSAVRVVQFRGGAAVNVTVSASHGGQVQVLDGSCELVGTKWVAPGVDRRVTLELWNDDGRRVSRSAVEDGVLVRVARHRGASDALYRDATAMATVGFGGGGCPASDRPSTPTPTPTPTDTPAVTPTPSPAETVRPTVASASDSPGGDGSAADGTATDGPGDGSTTGSDGPGFSVPAALSGLLALVLLRARYR